MEISQIIPHVEALIFAADRPLPMLEIVDLLNNALAFLEDRATLDQVEAAMEAIQEKYGSEFYAFEVRASGGGYQFLTKKDYYQTVAQLNGDKLLKRLSTAALETLAIIAYRQPISKGEIEHIRGVSTDYSIQKLLDKELIEISGRSEDLPGKPLLYATSKVFMDYFGLNYTADLPKLKELFDEEAIQPTLINEDTATIGRDDMATADRINGAMVISEDGELIEQDEDSLEADENLEIPPVHPEEHQPDEPGDTAPLMETTAAAEEIGGRVDEDAARADEEATPEEVHPVSHEEEEVDDINERRLEEAMEEEEAEEIPEGNGETKEKTMTEAAPEGEQEEEYEEDEDDDDDDDEEDDEEEDDGEDEEEDDGEDDGEDDEDEEEDEEDDDDDEEEDDEEEDDDEEDDEDDDKEKEDR